MGHHPLTDLSADAEVRRAAGFRQVASELTGEILAARYEEERQGAPRRREAGRKYLVAYNSRLAAGRRPARDAEHLSLALLDHCRRGGEGLLLPGDDSRIELVHAQVPLKATAPAKGEADPEKRIGAIDLLGLGPVGRLAVIQVRYLAPGATRGGTGDTPLRFLFEGLAHAAIAEANREALQGEITEAGGGTVAEGRPMVILLASPRYWELCRRREAQKGAAWIKELERLAREIDEALSIDVRYLACRLEGDPGWSYPEGRPLLDAPPRIEPAWEIGAGRVKPKPRPRPKTATPADVPVEPDLSRPVRDYSGIESYAPGDRIQHPTLGLGVVQGTAGRGKISVLFGDDKRLLVHERPASLSQLPPAPPGSA
jgi:hypothetical protein